MFQDLTRRATVFVTENAPGLLTGTGVVGTISTAVLTGRASYKAAGIIHQADIQYRHERDGHGQLDTVDKVKLVWPMFVLPTATGAATVAAIVMSNRIHAGQVAAMATLYSLSQDRFSEYRDKVTELYSPGKEQKVHDAAVQENVSKNPPGEVFVIGSGEVLCKDMFSGRYFRSSVDRIKKAENALNHCISNHDYADLTSFYLDIGLPRTGYSDNMGWNSANPLDVRYTTTMSDDDQPCIAIDFVSHPRSDFHQTY